MNRKSRDIGLIIVGALFLMGSAVCLLTSLVGASESRRWRSTPSVEEPDGFQAIGESGDVVLVGAIVPEVPVSEEGLALYERWEREIEYDEGERESRWRHNYDYDHKPTFDLLLGDHRVTVQNRFVVFLNPREMIVDEHVKLKGFAPEDVVTVMGTVASSSEPLAVQAETICGGERERCMRRLARSPVGPAIGAGLMVLVGAGMIWLGVRKPKAAA